MIAVKSGPNWLDRLRSNKGLPIADNLTLDHFLLHNQTDSSVSPQSNPDSNPTPTPTPTHLLNPTHSPATGNENRDIITGILCDLFHIGGTSQNSKFSTKKLPRKQSNPRIWSVCCVQKDENVPSSNSDNEGLKRKNECDNVEVEDDKQLIGYSKSEVSVIDTSSDFWKSDFLVFRRLNVWKVKEKKGKFRSHGTKKSKLDSHINIIIDSRTNKTKLSGDAFDSQQLRGKECLQLLNRGDNPQYCTGPEIRTNAPDSGNYIKDNVHAVSPEDGSYESEKRSSEESSKRS